MPGDTRTPIIVVSGFLGSGKTTLLKKVLATPELASSMLIVNEIGEIGIDHQLLERSDDATVLLDNGCMCCQLRGDLQALLVDLGMRRQRGEIPSFDRVIIETSGLAEPGPIAQTLYSDGPLAREYRLAHVVTLVDPLNEQARMASRAVAEAQVAVADLLVLTKSDVATTAQLESSLAWARGINSYAKTITATRGDLDITLLANPTPFAHPSLAAARPKKLFGATLKVPAGMPQDSADMPSGLADGPDTYLAQRLTLHPGNVTSFSLRLAQPLNRNAFDIFMSTLLRVRGQDLLRVKGIVYFQNEPGAQLVQGVCHIYDQPVAIDIDPNAPRESVLIFIVRNITKKQIEDYWQSLVSLM